MQRLLCLSYIERVNLEELKRAHADVQTLLADLTPDFRLLVDLSQLEFMGLDCVPEIGQIMELLDQRGVGLVMRVIPDPKKDIGLKILTIFHYRHQPRVVTCTKMADVAQSLFA